MKKLLTCTAIIGGIAGTVAYMNKNGLPILGNPFSQKESKSQKDLPNNKLNNNQSEDQCSVSGGSSPLTLSIYYNEGPILKPIYKIFLQKPLYKTHFASWIC